MTAGGEGVKGSRREGEGGYEVEYGIREDDRGGKGERERGEREGKG